MRTLQGFEVRPEVGTHRVYVLCKRCGGPVRDHRLGGVPSLEDLVDAAEAHEKRLHRPQLSVVVHQNGSGRVGA